MSFETVRIFDWRFIRKLFGTELVSSSFLKSSCEVIFDKDGIEIKNSSLLYSITARGGQKGIMPRLIWNCNMKALKFLKLC